MSININNTDSIKIELENEATEITNFAVEELEKYLKKILGENQRKNQIPSFLIKLACKSKQDFEE